MRRIAALGTAALLLAGCGAEQSDGSGASGPELPETAASETTTPEETTPAGPERNDRGNIVKQLGEEGGLNNLEGDPVITFTVDAIQPAQCTAEWREYGSPPENGHLVEVKLRVATAPEMAQDEMLSHYTVSGYDFDYIGPDGITVSAVDSMATYGCLPENVMFTQNPLGPGQQYVGSIVLDVPQPTGTLVYRPAVAEGGWEWQF